MVDEKHECSYDKACLRAPLRLCDEVRMMEVMVTDEPLQS